MKKKVKQILSALLVAVMLVGISAIDSETIKVKAAGYDATAAVKFANNHWNDGIGLCAEFVSRCLNAGGISIPNRSYYSSSTKSYANNSGTLGAYTNPYTCSASLLLYLSENYTIITNPSNSDIDVGDVVFMYSMSNGKLKYRDGHVGICVRKDNGVPKYAAHNKAQAAGSFSSGYPCTYVAKITGKPPTYAKLSTDVKSLYVGQTITFTCDSDTADYYNIGIDRNGSRILLKKVGHLFSYQCDEPGSYTAYVSAVNSNGYIDSNKVSWNVYVGASVSAKMKVMCSSKVVKSDCYGTTDTITNITSGDIINVTGYVYNSYGNLWYKININGKIGYVFWNYLEIVKTDSNMPSNYISTKMTVTCSSKSVRTTPYGDSDTTRDVNKNDVLSIVGYVYNQYGNLWYAIGPDEYVYCSYLKENGNNKAKSDYKYQTLIVNTNTTCKEDPYAAANTVGAVNKGDKVNIVGYVINKYGNKWYLTEDNTFIYFEELSPENFDFSFNSNGGTGSMSNNNVKYQSKLSIPVCTYSKNGYTFDYWTAYRVNDGTWATDDCGWLNSAQLSNQSIDKQIFKPGETYTIDDSWLSGCSDIDVEYVLYANWKINTYTVSYNMNGGTGSIASQTKTHGTNLTLTTIKPTGKSFTVTYNANGGTVSSSSKTVSQSFTNWNTAANGSGTAYNAGATYSTNASVTLYAQYANPSIGSLPTPTRSGYGFDGWYTSANGGTKITDSTKVTANTTVYAHWKANSYTVSYNVNGGMGSIASQTKTHDTNLTLTTTKPTGKSFTVTYNANGGTVSTSSKTVSQTFTNWNTAANGSGTAYNAGTTYSVNASVTLYAQYANPSIGSLPTPTRSGYNFDGWYTAANGGIKITETTTVTTDITLYAHWITNTYTVTYNTNGGSGTISTQTFLRGSTTNLSSEEPIGKLFIINYDANGGNVSKLTESVSQSFVNWNTKPDGSGSSYEVGEAFTANQNTILYAQYANPILGLIPTPTRIGYVFDGWYTELDGGKKVSGYTEISENLILFAHWTKKSTDRLTVNNVKIEDAILLDYKSDYNIIPKIDADLGSEYTITYESYDESIAKVDGTGKVHGIKKGNTVVVCTVTDSYGNVVKDSCNVNVDYSGAQWFIIIVLFGWIWYI